MKLICSAILEKVSTRADGSIIINLGLQEMPDGTGGKLIDLRMKYLKVLLSDSNISKDEVMVVDSQPLEGGKKPKSKSQRLRAVLWRLHEQSGLQVDFDTFYNTEMERIIEEVREKLDQ